MRLVLALAGFTKGDVEIVPEHCRLRVRGELNGPRRLYLPAASRAFERQFDLADFIEVTGATMCEGLLVIDLKREMPDELKPRRIRAQPPDAE
jgi:molecular chaperone IbpA